MVIRRIKLFIVSCLCLSIVLLYIGFPITSAQSCTKKSQGDTNCDGSIDLIDFENFREEFLAFKAGTLDITQAKADFNSDKYVDLLDFEVFRVGYLNQLTNPSITPTTTTSPTSTITATRTPTPSASPTKTPTPTASTTPAPTLPPGSGVGNYTCDTTISPGQSISSGISSASKVLCLHGGNYNGGVSFNKSGLTVAAVKGERPVITGCVTIDASGMVLDGINVTWGSGGCSHMVKLNASNVIIQNGEFWGAHAYAAMLVTNGASGWTIRNMYMHDIYKTNDTNQDHLIYVNQSSGGVIERCLFVNSPNGRGIKLGPPSGSGGPSNIIIRYNTFYNNTGPSNVQISYGSKNNQVYGNAMLKSGSYNITGYNLSGGGNIVKDNIGWESNGVFGGGGLVDGQGNEYKSFQFTNGYHIADTSLDAKYGKFSQ